MQTNWSRCNNLSAMTSTFATVVLVKSASIFVAPSYILGGKLFQKQSSSVAGAEVQTTWSTLVCDISLPVCPALPSVPPSGPSTGSTLKTTALKSESWLVAWQRFQTDTTTQFLVVVVVVLGFCKA